LLSLNKLHGEKALPTAVEEQFLGDWIRLSENLEQRMSIFLGRGVLAQWMLTSS
jgi:hypothetical protein